MPYSQLDSWVFPTIHIARNSKREWCKRTLQPPPPHPPNVLFALSNCPLLGTAPILIHANRRNIRLMEGNAKCRHLKKCDSSIFLDDDICNVFYESYLSTMPTMILPSPISRLLTFLHIFFFFSLY